MSTSVKYFHSAMADAPVLNGVAGSLIGVLDACLVNGFGVRTVNSLVVASGVATATVSAGHGNEVAAVVLVSGATPAGLNGPKRVVSATSTTFTFATTEADGAATGTISAKLAPAGWEKPFAGTNLAAYRSPNVEGTRCFLFVNDATAQNARVRGYEAMSDINTGVNPFPTDAQVSGGLWWPNASTTAATARTWVVVADDRAFYVWVNTSVSSFWGEGFLYGFGDFNSFKSGDAYSCWISGPTSNLAANGSASGNTLSYCDLAGDNAALGCYAARSFTALGSSMPMSRKAESYNTADAYSGNTASVAYPNGSDNSLLLSRTLITEASPINLRGAYPGLLFVPQALGAGTFGTRSKVDGQGGYAGRKLVALNNTGATASTTVGQATSFIDMTGPWR
jgi:hypothetical protein